ncbi:MAG: 2,3-bisphosphoglycerate-dependent phosphoglycerate mutase [Chloroflexota bacterium]|jgi:2,3-bisphosphoglycerate-dependent phosphoglycerate mutase|nr:2,3-bisphosphoglycerate-dependent phosphoglycerate mutase [Chloroflexota bacterium]
MSTLILLRHGESTWNLANRFTGWEDVPLSAKGREEAVDAGRMLVEAGHRPDVLHTSLQVRAIETAELALREAGLHWIPVRRSWRLNERHYGALQGLDKRETAQKYGDEQVLVWRRSYSTPPPAVELDDPRHPSHDPRYADLAPELLPATESLKEVVARMLPYWYDAVVPDLRAYDCVLLAAHGNSLRALVKHLDGVSEEEIVKLNIPTGIPRLYELDDRLKPVRWSYLGDPEAASARAAAVARQASAGAPDPA